MKRKLFLLLFLIGAMSVAAQTFSVTGLDLKSERIRKKNVYEWENFVLVNYNFGIMQSSEQKRHSFGISYGRVKLFGWYANFTIGTGGHYGYSYEAQRNGEINLNNSGIIPFYTGKSSLNRLSFTGGCIVRMVIPLYLYLGIGYGYVSTTREISSGQWVLMNPWSHLSIGHAVHWDFGLQGNIKGFTIAAGYSSLTDYKTSTLHEFKLSIGWTFKDKHK